jgi:hypothetical protein
MHIHTRNIFYIIILLQISGCETKISEEEAINIGVQECRRQPAFIRNTGLNPQRTALSTSESGIKGLVLVELPTTPTDTDRRTWKHPSWQQYGWMGPITTDDSGNSYVAPVPVINVLDNPIIGQNTIYKVESSTGIMAPFINLGIDSPSAANPYGILGLYYDCHAQLIYASSVAGSTKQQENGIVYAIHHINKKVVDKITGIDVMGICVSGVTGEKKIYFGHARQPFVYSIALTAKGAFKGVPIKEISLDMMGPRGDDKARRIRFDKNGDMLVFGIEFDYNLTAPTEKQETIYRFRFYDDVKEWRMVN